MRKYLAHQQKRRQPNRNFIKGEFETDEEKLNGEASEGAYTFRPEWKDPLPKQFSKLKEDITYQQGSLLDQWTIQFNDKQTKERAVINVRFTPLNPDFIEVEVELSPIPIKDG